MERKGVDASSPPVEEGGWSEALVCADCDDLAWEIRRKDTRTVIICVSCGRTEEMQIVLPEPSRIGQLKPRAREVQ